MSSRTCPHPVDCDFENPDHELCSWINTESSIENVEWQVYALDTWGASFGFVPDNTIGTIDGHFVLTSGIKQGMWSRLISEKVEPADDDEPVCLTFYYFFPNTGDYNLTVKLAEYNKPEVILWSLNDARNQQEGGDVIFEYDMWNMGQVSFETSDTYRIYFEGLVGSKQRLFVGNY